MRAPLVAVLFSLSVLAQEPESRKVTLVLPHALREDEIATLLVTVGVVPRGARITVTTPSGRSLGTISPHGVRAGREAGTYTVPLPADAVSGRRVSLLLSLHFRGAQRAPTTKEVKGVRVKVRTAKT